MTTEVTVFNFDKYEIRPVVNGDDILFNANEICDALGYGNPRQAIDTHVHDDDVQKLDTIDTMGRNQVANFVTESGMYALIFGSTKDEAKKFKHWVTHDVLPSIRKKGFYESPAYLQMKADAEKVETLLLENKALADENFELNDRNEYLEDKKAMWKDERIQGILRDEVEAQIGIRHELEEKVFSDKWLTCNGDPMNKDEAKSRKKFVKQRFSQVNQGLKGLERVIKGTEQARNAAILTYISIIRQEIEFAHYW